MARSFSSANFRKWGAVFILLSILFVSFAPVSLKFSFDKRIRVSLEKNAAQAGLVDLYIDSVEKINPSGAKMMRAVVESNAAIDAVDQCKKALNVANPTDEQKRQASTICDTAYKQVQAAKAAQTASSNEGKCSGASGAILCFPLTVINWILDSILGLLSKLLLFVIEIFMGFARYNDFGTAPPVQIGWPLVRDLVNMFFIVVVLVSAFATIIGYGQGEFHVKKVLPRLLLMAVLINFSKTLILVVVDFSQVVMLTFVNAFQQVAASGLATAFGVSKYTAMMDESSLATDRLNVMVSYMLAIIVAGSALAIMLILTLWVLGRIVGLWVALILAPLALFLTALPSKIGGKMGKIGSEYWSQLANLLTGGPIVAFFLWLTFSMLSSMQGTDLAQSLHLYQSASTTLDTSFLTKIGQSGQIAALLVAMVMLTKALEIATSSAKAIGGVVGDWAGKISTTAPQYAKWAATLPLSLAGRGVKAGGRAVERGTRGARAAAATFGMKTIGRVPMLGAALRPTLSRAMVSGAAATKKEAAEMLAGMKDMTYQQLEAVAPSLKPGPLASAPTREAYATLMHEMTSEKRGKELKKNRSQFHQQAMEKSGEVEKVSAELQKQNVPKDEAARRAKDDVKRRAGIMAEADVRKHQSDRLAEARKMYEGLGNRDQVEAIDKQIAQDPTLAGDQAGLEAAVAKIAFEPKALGEMTDKAKGDLGVATAIGVQHGLFKDDGAGNVTVSDPAKLKTKLKEIKNKVNDDKLFATIEAAANRVTNSRTGSVAKSVLSDISLIRDKDGEKRTYNKKTGERERSDKQNEAFSALAPLRSRAAGASLNAADIGQYRNFIDTGGSIVEGLAQANNEQDHVPIADISREIVRVDVAAAMAAPDTATANRNLQTFNVLVNDLPKMDSQSQISVIANFMAAGGATMLTDTKKWNGVQDKKALQQMVETAIELKKGGILNTTDPVHKRVLDFNDALASASELPRPIRNMVSGANELA